MTGATHFQMLWRVKTDSVTECFAVAVFYYMGVFVYWVGVL